jgi:hypothetical protein
MALAVVETWGEAVSEGTDQQPLAPESTPTTRLVASGAGAVGVGGGAVIGFLAGGPPGAFVGGAAGALLQDGMKSVVGEAAVRFTSQTEQERVGSCLILAHEKIAVRLNDGQPLRDESFFKPRTRRNNDKLRSEAEELLEGTFLAARDAYEERKVALLANFYANIAFTDEVDSSHANHLLTLAKSLTYRQLVILGIIGQLQDRSTVRDADFRHSDNLSALEVGVLYEVYQMVGLDLISSVDGAFMLGLADIKPANLTVMGNGAHLFNLLELHTVGQADRQFYFEAFKPLR